MSINEQVPVEGRMTRGSIVMIDLGLIKTR
jgi:hypothetical protein